MENIFTLETFESERKKYMSLAILTVKIENKYMASVLKVCTTDVWPNTSTRQFLFQWQHLNDSCMIYNNFRRFSLAKCVEFLMKSNKIHD